MNLIEYKNTTIAFQNTPILEGINWQIKKGEHWIITGLSGAGKTTLARSITGKMRIKEGSIHYPFLGEKPKFEQIRQHIKMVSFSDTSKLFRSVNVVHYYQQRYNAWDSEGHLTVEDYLKTGGFDRENEAHLILVKQTGVADLLDMERIKLSSGQTRKMLITKAILSKPTILIIDNPYLGLDAPSRVVFNELIDSLAASQEMTIILSGQYEALPKCISHCLHLEKGTVKTVGKFNNQINNDDLTPEIKKSVLDDIKTFFENRVHSEKFDSIIKLNKVAIRYGQKDILKNIDWTVKPGEKWALLGNNGAGKSTLLSLVYGDNPQAYANDIYLFDVKRGSGESIWDIKRRIGFTSSELHAFFDFDMKARDLVLSGLSDAFFVRQQPEKAAFELTRLFFDYFDIKEYYLAPFHQLSTSVQRLLFFIRALIKMPPFLLLDEPFQGFDQPTIEKCRILLDEVLDERYSLIFITHFQSEIPSSVDKIFRL